MEMRKNYNRLDGFSLLELLITLLLLSVLFGLAIPPLAAFKARQELNSFQQDLTRLIRHARHHALLNKTRVSICTTDNTGKCSTLEYGSLTSFIDEKGRRMLKGDTDILMRLDIPSSLKVQWRGMRPRSSLHFSPYGMTFVSNGTFTLCHRKPNTHHLKTVISPQGRIRSSRIPAQCPRDS
ncbi:GspH/FimT family protein [Metapseudomonas otitidis]|uniref:GspH/FimT family protein n=1 Tax=Metapseudomonas otitidis TaxID=319939 RepID=UPI00244CB499|nr:GspH/FimT family protein [Pseudomonas otitidis]MDH0336609.1 GspH/FimT family protein [Pseudomonas otitidis]